MLRLLRILVVLAIVLALGAGAAMMFAPVESYRDGIENAVAAATGRQVEIQGPVSLVFFPEIALDLGPVTIAGPDGTAGGTLSAANAVASLQLLPLLGGAIRVSGIILTGADIFLRPGSFPLPGNGTTATPLRIADVTLVDSRIHLKDDSRDIALEARDLRLTWPRDGASLAVNGTIGLGGETFEIDAATDRPEILLGGEGHLPLTLAFEGPLATGSLAGDIDLTAFAYEGQLTLTTPSARRVLALYGVSVPGDRGLHSLSVAATLRAQPGQAQLRNAKFTLDATTGSGAFGLKLNQGRLALAGTLSADRIDTGAYAAFQEPPGAPYTNGWSAAGLDLSGLRDMDIDIQLNARRGALAGIQLSDIDAEFVSANGRATLTIARATAHAGAIAGRLTADVTTDLPLLSADFTVSNFDAKSLFETALETGALAGRGNLTFRLTGRGTSQADLVRTLDGDIALTLSEGALDGIDVTAVARSLASGGPVRGASPESATDIQALSVQFKIAGGIARIEDLTLTAPYVRLSARGTAGLAARTMRFQIAPRFVPESYGDPQAPEGRGLAMPFAAIAPGRSRSSCRTWPRCATW